MKFFHKISVFAASLAIVTFCVSCDDDNPVVITEANMHPTDILSVSTTSHGYLQLWLTSPLRIQGQSPNQQHEVYSFDARFEFPGQRGSQDVDSVWFGEVALPFSNLPNEIVYSREELNYNWTTNPFGNTTVWSFDGNTNFLGQTDSITLPDILQASVAGRTASKANGIPLQWNAEPMNTHGVKIIVFSDPSQPNQQFFDVIVPDNGAYTVPTSALNAFPDSTQTVIWLHRGNYKVINDSANARKYYFYGVTQNQGSVFLMP